MSERELLPPAVHIVVIRHKTPERRREKKDVPTSDEEELKPNNIITESLRENL